MLLQSRWWCYAPQALENNGREERETFFRKLLGSRAPSRDKAKGWPSGYAGDDEGREAPRQSAVALEHA